MVFLVSQLPLRYSESESTQDPEALMKQILICDNNPIFAQYLAQEVEKLMPSTHEISICHSAEELRSAVVSYPPDIVLLYIRNFRDLHHGIH